ncbi:glycosyltransferase family 4 protein [Marinobacterium aestuarii]|uniref:glycosyltransferase family 4 protein n=1 Tax=Marinobacterium aestuarii TaxID=1821621 RepID=UPI000A07145F|nr:glycosyltransferase family 4 protein [Marinobacterium aestuarii]
MKILLLSRYGTHGASSRVRFLQYLPYLRQRGIELTVSPLLSNRYLDALYKGKQSWPEVCRGYVKRLFSVISGIKYDLVIIEKELFPFMPSWFEFLLKKTGVKYIVDYDDALFHRYDKHPRWPIRALFTRKIDSVMKHASLVIAGNEYLAQRARAAGASRVEILPSVVDLERYQVREQRTQHKLIIGWIGTPKTCHYLFPLKDVFLSLRNDFDVRFVAVGARPEQLKDMPIEAWPWSEATEVELIQRFDVGIMPLHDSPWERGKCGYKLIQYMACGVPVVSSPVGVNKNIVEPDVNGYLPEDLAQWREALLTLLKDKSKRVSLGENGRDKVERLYSLQIQAPRLLALLQDVSY